ncbi:hypothetical protein AB1Y20_019289 [Prymnesium parvum]|uniref:Uncharacterized protein n=1 Tax=Prymnesium parvum TaxID=97485 RepID=A0AB34JVF7_PRYPA
MQTEVQRLHSGRRPDAAFPPLSGSRSARATPVPRRASDVTGLEGEQYPKEFWLSRRTCLTPSTPISAINSFCCDHGFYIWGLKGKTPAEQRLSLYKMLEENKWPEGYDGLMRALQQPQASRPTRLPPKPPPTAPPQLPPMERRHRKQQQQLDPDVDQLVRVIQQQTEMTQRFQQILTDQRTGAGRAEADDQTMRLIRDHASLTSSLARLEDLRPASARESPRQQSEHPPRSALTPDFGLGSVVRPTGRGGQEQRDTIRAKQETS